MTLLGRRVSGVAGSVTSRFERPCAGLGWPGAGDPPRRSVARRGHGPHDEPPEPEGRRVLPGDDPAVRAGQLLVARVVVTHETPSAPPNHLSDTLWPTCRTSGSDNVRVRLT